MASGVFVATRAAAAAVVAVLFLVFCHVSRSEHGAQRGSARYRQPSGRAAVGESYLHPFPPLRAGPDAQPQLHGRPARYQRPHARHPGRLAGGCACALQADARSALPDRQPHRPFSQRVLGGAPEAAAGRRHRHACRQQVRGDLRTRGARLCVHIGQGIHSRGDPEDGGCGSGAARGRRAAAATVVRQVLRRAGAGRVQDVALPAQPAGSCVRQRLQPRARSRHLGRHPHGLHRLHGGGSARVLRRAGGADSTQRIEQPDRGPSQVLLQQIRRSG
eukprot:ctg_662.g248